MSFLKRFLLSSFVIIVVGGSLILYWVSNHYVVPIMMYHHVEETDEYRPDTISPDLFDWHMQFLSDRGYYVISLKEFVDIVRSGGDFSRNMVVITFDDGHADNYKNAYSVLKKYNFPATFFVPSDLINTEDHLTTEQLKDMAANGMTIASHTRRHRYLPEVSLNEQEDEIKNSKNILEELLGVRVDYFAYPVGGFNETIKDLVKLSGYDAAVTTNRGYDRYNKDPYELNRVRFSDRDIRVDILLMKLSGYYNLFRKMKSPD